MKAQPPRIPQLGEPGWHNLIENEGNAIQEAVAWHTVCLIVNKSESIGTGSAILWRGQPLILTANHVVKDSLNDDIYFHFRHQGTMKIAPLDKLHSHPEMNYTRKVKIEIGHRYTSEALDLAVLEVQESISKEHLIQFFPLTKDSITPPPGTIITMRGYPSDLARTVAPQTAASYAMIQWSRIEKNPQFEPFNPETEFLTRFKPNNLHARGYSGAGVWFDKPTSGVWHPNLGLAGVCTHYYSRRKLLSVVRIEPVIRFLDTALPIKCGRHCSCE